MKPRSHTYGLGRIFRKTRRGVPYGNVLVEYFVDGRQHRENSQTRDEQAALRLLKQRLGELVGGRTPAPRAAQVTVAELFDDLAARYALEDRPNRRNLPAYRASWLAALGPRRRATTLETAELTAITLTWKRAGVAPATVNKRCAALHRVLTLGQSTTPPKVLRLPTFPPKLPEENVREGWTEYTAFQRLLAYLAHHDPVLRDYLEWFFWTGMRPGAIRDLGWGAIDRETWALRLVRGRRMNKRTPKWLPLRGPLRAIVTRAWERHHAHARATGVVVPWVFFRLYDGQPRPGLRRGDAVRVVDYRKAWRSACAAAGIPAALRPYDLRRTAIRNLKRAGNDDVTCMAITGHRTRATFDRYNIVEGTEVAAALDRTFAAVTAGEMGADVGRISVVEGRQGAAGPRVKPPKLRQVASTDGSA